MLLTQRRHIKHKVLIPDCGYLIAHGPNVRHLQYEEALCETVQISQIFLQAFSIIQRCERLGKIINLYSMINFQILVPP